MFRGSSFHSIDPKGRLIVPARYRDVIKASGTDGIVVTFLDECIVAYTVDVWNQIENRILALPETTDKMRRFRRIYIGLATECLCDKQGRVLIPPTLRQIGKLKKEIVLVGVLDHFEVWSRDLWEGEKALLEEDMQKEDVRNEIAKLGL